MNLAKQLLVLHEKSLLPDQILKSDILMDMVVGEIENMASEIEQSQAGQRSGFMDMDVKGKGQGVFRVTSTKSTFPEYLQPLFNYQGTKKKFLSAAKKGKGKVWDRIALIAIERLTHGYSNHHGYDEPSKDFLDELANPTPF